MLVKTVRCWTGIEQNERASDWAETVRSYAIHAELFQPCFVQSLAAEMDWNVSKQRKALKKGNMFTAII